jgi:hypothetical protein
LVLGQEWSGMMQALILQQLPGGYKCFIESRETGLFGENAGQDAPAVIAGRGGVLVLPGMPLRQ